MQTLLVASALVAAGCTPPVPSAADLNAGYAAALERTTPLAADFLADSEAEQAAFRRLTAFFSAMTSAGVAAQAGEVYAPDAYLNDTLVSLEGVDAIRDYFLVTMERAAKVDVRFLDRARTGNDYYVRWLMTIEADGLAGGAATSSYGITQFRFDDQGRVLLHKDFWDSGTGMYEHLPVIGGLISRIRLAAHPE